MGRMWRAMCLTCGCWETINWGCHQDNTSHQHRLSCTKTFPPIGCESGQINCIIGAICELCSHRHRGMYLIYILLKCRLVTHVIKGIYMRCVMIITGKCSPNVYIWSAIRYFGLASVILGVFGCCVQFQLYFRQKCVSCGRKSTKFE